MESKPILFVDFDGTLCFDRFWRSLEPALYNKIQSFLFKENKIKTNEWMLGKRSSEEINETLARYLQVPPDSLWQLFQQDCETMWVDQELLNKINSLRKKFYTILITDNMDCFDRFTTPALELNKYFDVIVNSFREQKFKSDSNGELFVKYTNKFNSPIKSSVLIDNSVKTCNVFSRLGGTVYLVTSDESASRHLSKL